MFVVNMWLKQPLDFRSKVQLVSKDRITNSVKCNGLFPGVKDLFVWSEHLKQTQESLGFYNWRK